MASFPLKSVDMIMSRFWLILFDWDCRTDKDVPLSQILGYNRSSRLPFYVNQTPARPSPSFPNLDSNPLANSSPAFEISRYSQWSSTQGTTIRNPAIDRDEKSPLLTNASRLSISFVPIATHQSHHGSHNKIHMRVHTYEYPSAYRP